MSNIDSYRMVKFLEAAGYDTEDEKIQDLPIMYLLPQLKFKQDLINEFILN